MVHRMTEEEYSKAKANGIIKKSKTYGEYLEFGRGWDTGFQAAMKEIEGK
jgi:hypothetical protein